MKIDVERLLNDYIYYCFYQTLLYVTETSEKETQNIYKKFEAAIKIRINHKFRIINVYNFKNSLNLN